MSESTHGPGGSGPGDSAGSGTVSGIEEASGPAKRKVIGPGLVVAATGGGAAATAATLVRGSQATGKTIFEGWRSLGRWTPWYFGPYILIWGFVYGATAMSSAALPLAALFPGLNLTVCSMLMGLAGFAMVWFGRYAVFEKI